MSDGGVERTPRQRRPKRDPEHMTRIGRKGGQTVSQDREHMAEIGRKGGEARRESLGADGYRDIGRRGGETVSRNREHMSDIGRRGAAVRRQRRQESQQDQVDGGE